MDPTLAASARRPSPRAPAPAPIRACSELSVVLTNAWPVTRKALQRGFSPRHPTLPLPVPRIALIFFTTHFQTNYSGEKEDGEVESRETTTPN